MPAATACLACVSLLLYSCCDVKACQWCHPTPTHRQRKCLHEHWKSCHDYPEAHTWETRDQKDIEEEEAVRALVAAEDNSYLAYDEACRVRQLVTGSDLSNKPGGRVGWNCPGPQGRWKKPWNWRKTVVSQRRPTTTDNDCVV
ncbi:hypothetical protein EI94DRAFT_1704947 [Lactarius quietus]|nr:hypothetical protein EI94DRAFT_1704947 [Lactarius quietus]